MSFVTANRVLETTTTTGTGSLTLAGAVAGYQSFNAALTSGDTCHYVISDPTNNAWELGLATFTSPSALARTTVYASSNAGAAVTLAAGTKQIFIAAISTDVVPSQDGNSGLFLTTDGTTPSWLAVPWGSLAGTLASQTDLQSALDGKQNQSGILDTVASGTIGDAYTWPTNFYMPNNIPIQATDSLGNQPHILKVSPTDYTLLGSAGSGIRFMARDGTTVLAQFGDNGTATMSINSAPGASVASGLTVTLTSAQTQAIGDVCTINSSGQATLAEADSLVHASGVFIATAAVTGSASNTYLMQGVLRLAASASWTKGGLIYLSTTGTTTNTMTQTAPSATGTVKQPLGVALDVGTILFNPSLSQVVNP